MCSPFLHETLCGVRRQALQGRSLAKNISCVTKKGFCMPTDQSTAFPWREKMTFAPQTRGVEGTRLIQPHAPDFLLTWRPVSGLGDVFTPEFGATHLSRANGQHAPSEAEALQRWLAAGGELDVASLYGLEIIADDDTLDRFSKEPSGEEANPGQSRTV